MKSLLLTALTAILLGNLGHNQIFAQTNTPASPTPPNPTIPLPLIQAVPLVQASSKLLGQQTYQIESEIELSAIIPDAPLVKQAYLKTTIAAPNQVNTEITFFDQEKRLDQQYQIISNGTQLWIYDVVANQYSVSEYKQFIQSSAGLTVGTLANFYLKTLNTVNSNRIASRAIAKLPPDRLVKYFQRFANIDLQNMVIRNEEIDGIPYAIYDIDAIDRSYELTTYVAPPSANIERIDLVGSQDGLNVLLVEQILSQTIPPAIPADTFTFIPPEDAEQMESQIEINPFLAR